MKEEEDPARHPFIPLYQLPALLYGRQTIPIFQHRDNASEMPLDADEDETREVDRDDEEHDSGAAATCTDNEKGQDKEEDCHRVVGKEDGEAPEKGDKEAEPDFGHDGEYLPECYLLCGVDASDGVNDRGRG